MEYLPAWEDVRARLKAFWSGEAVGRPLISVTAPNGRTPREIPPPTSTQQGFLDYDYVLDCQEEHIRCTYYAGEAIPSLWPNFGPAITAACMGGNLEIRELLEPGPLANPFQGADWTTPVIKDWRQDLPRIGFDPDNPWWKRTLEFTCRAVARSKGKFLVRTPDIEGGLDTCDALRGTSRLCMDLYDQPEQVLGLLQIVENAKKEIVPRLCRELSRYEEGCVSTFQEWGPGPFYSMRCDFAYLVRPRMFRATALEHMIREAEYLYPCTLFHCHNEDYDRNRAARLAWLDVVCSIPSLRGVQWPLPPSGDLEGHRLVLARGKFLYTSVEASDIVSLLDALGSTRVWLRVRASCPEEADAAVRMVKEWSRRWH
jgi:hypothetical protein